MNTQNNIKIKTSPIMFNRLQQAYQSAKNWVQNGTTNLTGQAVTVQRPRPRNRVRIRESINYVYIRGCQIVGSHTFDIVCQNFLKASAMGAYLLALKTLGGVEYPSPLFAYILVPAGFVVLTTADLIMKNYVLKEKEQIEGIKDVIDQLEQDAPSNSLSLSIHQTMYRNLLTREPRSWLETVNHPVVLAAITESIDGVSRGEKCLRVFHTSLAAAYTAVGFSGAVFVYFILREALLLKEHNRAISMTGIGIGTVAGAMAALKTIRDLNMEWQDLIKRRTELNQAVTALCHKLNRLPDRIYGQELQALLTEWNTEYSARFNANANRNALTANTSNVGNTTDNSIRELIDDANSHCHRMC